MNRVAAIIVLGFASLPGFAQDAGDPPIRVAPPSMEELTPRPDVRRAPDVKHEPSRLEPMRRRIAPKPLAEQPGETKSAPGPQHRPARAEVNEVVPVRGEDLPKGVVIPRVDPNPPLPTPGYAEVPLNVPAPDETPIEDLVPRPVTRPLYIDLQTADFTTPGAGSLFGPRNQVRNHWSHDDLFQYRVGTDAAFALDGVLRGYYRNDQRIEWSGVEATFGAEGVLRPSFVSRTGDWVVSSQGEFFLNSRFGSSMLSDPNRDLFRSNFDVETFQVFQLFVEANYDEWTLRFGRSRTPFGRYQSPMFTNSMQDAPFLRTEVIGFVENGIFVHYAPGGLVVDLAIVNGEADLDTNSSKGVVTRWGFEDSNFTAGISVKFQDGTSSEYQKRFNNVYGIDASVALGRFLIYGEAMIDAHGFLRDAKNNPDYNPYNLGVRSLYGRDVFKSDEDSINGRGVYLGVTYRADDWLVDLCYGSYSPEKIGDDGHDKPTNRFLFKTAYIAAKNLELYLVVLAENKRITEGLLGRSNPYAAWFGMQYGF